MSEQTEYIPDPLADAAAKYAPIEKGMTKDKAIQQGMIRFAFASGGRWQRNQIMPDFKFILEALPNEHRIADLQFRAELDLVRRKLNEIIAKLH